MMYRTQSGLVTKIVRGINGTRLLLQNETVTATFGLFEGTLEKCGVRVCMSVLFYTKRS